MRRSHPLAAYCVRRLAIGVVLLALVSVLVFGATQILPGSTSHFRSSTGSGSRTPLGAISARRWRTVFL